MAMQFQKNFNPQVDDLSTILNGAAPNVLVNSFFNAPNLVTLVFSDPVLAGAPLPRGPLVATQLHSPQPERGIRT